MNIFAHSVFSGGSLVCVLLFANTTLALSDNSPFIPNRNNPENPPENKAATAPSDFSKHFKLKGLILLNNEFTFSVHDERIKKSKWLKLGETINNFTLIAYDANSMSVSLDWNGIVSEMKIAGAELTTISNRQNLKTIPNTGKSTQKKFLSVAVSNQENKSSRNLHKTMSANPSSANHNHNIVRAIRTKSLYPQGSTVIYSGNDYFGIPENKIVTILKNDDYQPKTLELSKSLRDKLFGGYARINRVNNPGGKPPSHL